MGLSYNPVERKWNIGYEKTDYQTNLPTNLETVNNFTTVLIRKGEEVPYFIGGSLVDKNFYSNQINKKNQAKNDFYITVIDTEANEANAQENAENEALNKQNAALNEANASLNASYDKVVAIASSTQGGDYLAQRKLIEQVPNIDATNEYKKFYQTEKLQQWDLNLGAKPPYGTFDSAYYKEQNPAASEQWQRAVEDDNIDITNRYGGETGYYLYHYTTQGKPAGARGNPVEETIAANQYLEDTPTDSDLETVRDVQLGVDPDTQTQRFLNIPEIAAEWEKAKQGDPYWKQKGKELFLNANKPDEFAALFRLSERPEDKAIAFNYNLNAGAGITELEDVLTGAVGEKALVDVKRFGALTQDVLKQTINEMKKAKAKEQQMSLFSGLGSFKEIMDINKELTGMILGDSGVGGIMSFTGGDAQKAEESLEKSLRGISGVNNSVVYNWQNWFDNTLKQKYQSDLELGLTADQAEENVKIQGEFAREFIDKYLIPRFNESRSMNEFVEYLDVRQSEQNPFQTQDLLNATKLIADVRAQSYIDQLKATPGRYFDSEFYFSPTGNKAREAAYADQAKTVADDWEAAKKGDPYWTSQAYRFGIDLNNKDAFARMHFQVKGQGKGYDAADDILNASKVSDYIYNTILPAVNEEIAKTGTIFGQFIKPEEFADEMLKGLDPADKTSWNEVLERYGLKDFTGTVEDLKKYIAETLRTGSAQEIREQIKFLNERKEKPTQEILGVTYIQRDEDYKQDQEAKGETELYKVFQSAGFKGTEDEFYTDFFPDVNRSEQEILTKAGKGTALKVEGLDLSDPFASLGTIESFFGEDEDVRNKYSTIDDEEDTYTKTNAGQGFLDEFTSMFK